MSTKKADETTIKQKLAALGELVAWFESDEFDIETAMDKYKEAELLAKSIETELNEFKHTITVLKNGFDHEE